MMTNEYMLESRGIRPTAIRIVVLRAMFGFKRAFSLADLEDALDTIDRSTISRTINIFREHHLIHSIDDGSGSIKYSICRVGCYCAPTDLHLHFHCTRCGATICIDSIPIPRVKLPEGFTLESGNFVLKGLCNKCS